MAIDGMWTMNDDYEFELAEPYNSMLFECKLLATKAWRDFFFNDTATPEIYTREQLKDGLMYRNDKTDMHHTERVNEFILEALGGDL